MATLDLFLIHVICVVISKSGELKKIVDLGVFFENNNNIIVYIWTKQSNWINESVLHDYYLLELEHENMATLDLFLIHAICVVISKSEELKKIVDLGVFFKYTHDTIVEIWTKQSN